MGRALCDTFRAADGPPAQLAPATCYPDADHPPGAGGGCAARLHGHFHHVPLTRPGELAIVAAAQPCRLASGVAAQGQASLRAAVANSACSLKADASCTPRAPEPDLHTLPFNAPAHWHAWTLTPDVHVAIMRLVMLDADYVDTSTQQMWVCKMASQSCTDFCMPTQSETRSSMLS